MNARRLIQLLLVACLPLHAIASDWDPELRGAIDRETCERKLGAKWIRAPLAHAKPKAGDFDLAYFTPGGFAPGKPTAIYLDGGPGGVISPARNPTTALQNPDWNVVFFHIRGAGCSQLPASSDYDERITAEEELGDVEGIRNALGLDAYDVVVGGSYGAWLATRYSSAFPTSMRAVLVEGLHNPIWRSRLPLQDYERENARVFADLMAHLAAREDFSESAKAKEAMSDRERIALFYQEVLAAQRKAKLNLTLMVALPQYAKAYLEKHSTMAQQAGWESTTPEFFQAFYLANYVGSMRMDDALSLKQRSIFRLIAERVEPGSVDPAAYEEARTVVGHGLSAALPEGESYPTLSYRVASTLFPKISQEASTPALRHPTLIVAGGFDLATSRIGARARAEAECVGNCVFASVDGGGHSVGSSLPTRLYPELLNRLRDGDLAGASAILAPHTTAVDRL